jgi:DNA-binding response OmpR family regulator
MDLLRRARVLVVSSESNRPARVLALGGQFDTIEAHDGLAALAVARRQTPDAIVADLVLPSLDGIALCAALRRDGPLALTPVLVVANRADDRDVVRALDAGADDCLDASVSPARLVARIHALVRRSTRERPPIAPDMPVASAPGDRPNAPGKVNVQALTDSLRAIVASSDRLVAELAEGTSSRRIADEIRACAQQAIKEVTDAAAVGLKPPLVHPAVAASAASIVFVDDEPGVRTIGRKVLERQGYRVTLAASGEEALALCRDEAFALDLLVTDIAMPGMRGSELAARLRRARRGLRVLYISGYSGAVALQRGVEPGEHFLAKPFGPTDLAQKVREVLASSPAI